MMPAVANDGQKENLSQISTTIPFALCVNIKTRNKWESLKQQNLKKKEIPTSSTAHLFTIRGRLIFKIALRERLIAFKYKKI